jgi:two-component system CheB/CheR fusion protein
MWVVGIGSSTGGIEALRELLPTLPDGDIAYVVAQHMSPDHASLLADVLERVTSLKVAEIIDGMPIRPGVVFVAPPDSDIEVVAAVFTARRAAPRISPQPSIDVLLTSLAAEAGAFAIGIVLSGTGSDGTTGAEAVQAAGGHTLAQTPGSARFAGMPSAAIESGAIELVLSPAQMGDAITSIMQGHRLVLTGGQISNDPVMAALARETRRVTGWDLSSYKEGTLGRQLAKRIGLLHLASAQDYLAFVQDQPTELANLRDAVLIPVTRFARDPIAFESLRTSLVELTANRHAGDSVRAWVAGCATGQEAYSVAMLLLEVRRTSGVDFAVKVFATDISDAALDVARRGEYPTSALSELPSDWAGRYFTVSGERAQVTKSLREQLIFARQDVTRDPPLVRMDLVSCRNLLIYLLPSIQQRVLSSLHASLNPDGLLFLGRSESIPDQPELFATVHPSDRIFRKIGTASLSLGSRFPEPAHQPARSLPGARTRMARDRLRDDVRDRLLDQFAPPSILIDSAGTPIHQVGEVEKYLRLPDANGDFTIPEMIIPSLRVEAAALLDRVARGSQSQAGHVVVIPGADGQFETLRLQVSRVEFPGYEDPYSLISFAPDVTPAPERAAHEGTPSESAAASDSEHLSAQVTALEGELEGTRAHLRAVVEELEASNEELQALNEELQASSEELQATNEELEATNEELEATNEELTTVNEALEVRTSELWRTNVVLNNIQSSVLTAVVLLDADQRVLQFSPLAVKVFGLVDADIGTRLSQLPSHLDTNRLKAIIDEVSVSGEGSVSEVSSTAATYLLQVMPYEVTGVVTGTVLALSDITDLARTRAELAVRSEEFRMLAEAVPNMVYRTNLEMTEAQYLSPSVEAVFGVPHADADLDALRALVHPDDERRVVDNFVAHASTGYAIDYRIVRPDGQVRVIRNISNVRADDPGLDAYRIGTAIDITDLKVALDEAERQRHRAQSMFDFAGTAMATLTREGMITAANTYMRDLLDYADADLVGAPLSDFIEPGDVDTARRDLDALTQPETTHAASRIRFRDSDGRLLHIDENLATIRLPATDIAPEDSFVFATLVDVTEAEVAKVIASDREAQVEAVFTRTAAPMLLGGFDGLVTRANAAACELFGYTKAGFVGRSIADLGYPDDLAADLALFGELARGTRDSYSLEKRFLTREGEVIWGRLMVDTTPLGGPDGGPVVLATILDVTAEHIREAAALHLAQSDALTGLANRVLVFDRFRQAILRAERTGEGVAVLFIDLEDFKVVNDRYGHDAGDAVLTTVADRLRSLTRASDSVARLGGDEFLVMIPLLLGEETHETFTLADKLRLALAEPITVVVGHADEPRDVRITASIGVAQFPNDGSDVEDLMRKADIAMYSAKQRGGNRVRFYSERLQDHSRLRSIQRSEIREAIDAGQFVPYFQPVVDALTRAPVGVEVLARWNHPERGVLSPIDFLDMTIEFNLLDRLTEYLLDRVIEELPLLRSDWPLLNVSFNLAPSQLMSPTVVDLILARIGPVLDGWTFEITEAAAFGDNPLVLEGLGRLRVAGARLSLDDFGSGYSSVTHLQAFAFDEVKIDRGFVIHTDEGSASTLVTAMVAMAHALGATTVAEGIEQEAQAVAVAALGVDVLQGYLTGRPMPASTLVPWLAERAERA